MSAVIYSEARNAFADIFDAAIAHAPARALQRPGCGQRASVDWLSTGNFHWEPA